MVVNDCKGEHEVIKWGVKCLHCAQKTNQMKSGPTETGIAVNWQQMVMSAPRVPPMRVGELIVQPASSPYSREIKWPQQDEAVKHPFCKRTHYAGRLAGRSLGTPSLLFLVNAKGLLHLCHIPMSANERQFLRCLTNIWKGIVWKLCILNVSSTFLLPDPKTKQLQWHQLRKNKTNRKLPLSQLGDNRSSSPSPQLFAAVCCQSRKYEPWHFSSALSPGWLLSTSR